MLALEMQAKALLEATTTAPASKPQATSLVGDAPWPAPASAAGDPDHYEPGTEPENDHDGLDDAADNEPAAPSIVRFEVMVDEEQRRAIVATLNKAKEETGSQTLGAALHAVCIEWMEGRS